MRSDFRTSAPAPHSTRQRLVLQGFSDPQNPKTLSKIGIPLAPNYAAPNRVASMPSASSLVFHPVSGRRVTLGREYWFGFGFWCKLICADKHRTRWSSPREGLTLRGWSRCSGVRRLVRRFSRGSTRMGMGCIDRDRDGSERRVRVRALPGAWKEARRYWRDRFGSSILARSVLGSGNGEICLGIREWRCGRCGRCGSDVGGWEGGLGFRLTPLGVSVDIGLVEMPEGSAPRLQRAQR